MKDNQTNHSQWRLVISLVDSEIKVEDGFGSNILVSKSGRARFTNRFDFNGMSVWLVGKAYGVKSVNEIKEWAESFNAQAVTQWAQEIDGDWVAITLDRARNTINIISDRNGASRIYYAKECENVVVASSLWDIIPLTVAPKTSSFVAFTLLTTYYTLDPYTLIDPIRVTMPGQSIEINKEGIITKNYYEQVQLSPQYYINEDECVHELDIAFRRVFRKRLETDSTPMVLLSGGIDSVAMVRYLSELSETPIHTLTFSVAGQEEDEHEPAKIAAKHFGTVHHELVIDSEEAIGLFVQACIERRTPNISTMLYIAARNYVLQLRGNYDVYSGEDGRIHTPDFDLAKQFSIWLNMTKGRPRLPKIQRVISKLLSLWPWYPKNYLRMVANQITPQPHAQRFFLEHVNKFSAPSGFNLEESSEFNRLLDEVVEFSDGSTISDVFRKNTKMSHRLQHTDNLAVTSVMECDSIVKHSPFFDWEAVNVFNRIPFSLGSRGVFTLQSWSRFLMVNKRILRRVLKGSVPDAILYRRKNVASALDVLVRGGLFDLIEIILDKWYIDLLQSVGKDVGALTNTYVEKFRSGSLDMKVVYATLSICYMALINQICLDPGFDIDAELKRIREELKKS
jgi:hypothetical protein